MIIMLIVFINWPSPFLSFPVFSDLIKNIDFIPSSQALVQLDWKYIFWPDYNVEQLFDLKSDKAEEVDLVLSSSHQKKLAEMRARFATLKDAAK